MNRRHFCALFLALSAGSLLLASFATPAAAQTTVLFHGSGVDATNGADAAVLAHLQSRFTAANVTYMQGNAAAADGSSADGFDLVIISSTLGSGTVRGKYADSPVPLINWEQALMRQRNGEFNMSTNGRTNGSQTQITIVDPTHPLAAGLSGDVTVFSTPHTMSFGRDALGAGVSLIASGADPNDHAIMAADVGDALLGDGSPGNPATAPARRVMFFLEDDGFGDITPDGLALFDAAVTWAAIPEPSAMALCLLGALTLGCRRRRA